MDDIDVHPRIIAALKRGEGILYRNVAFWTGVTESSTDPPANRRVGGAAGGRRPLGRLNGALNVRTVRMAGYGRAGCYNDVIADGE